MSTFVSWLPTAAAFLLAFALASLVSGLTYGLARLPSMVLALEWVQMLVSVAALCIVFMWVGVLASYFPMPVLLLFVALMGASGGQSLIEHALEGPLTSDHHFARSFFTYLATASLLFVLVSGLVNANAYLHLVRVLPGWLKVSTLHLGLLAGWLFAPLSISFYRLLFQNIKLRPGVDRPLRDKELVG